MIIHEGVWASIEAMGPDRRKDLFAVLWAAYGAAAGKWLPAEKAGEFLAEHGLGLEGEWPFERLTCAPFVAGDVVRWGACDRDYRITAVAGDYMRLSCLGGGGHDRSTWGDPRKCGLTMVQPAYVPADVVPETDFRRVRLPAVYPGCYGGGVAPPGVYELPARSSSLRDFAFVRSATAAAGGCYRLSVQAFVDGGGHVNLRAAAVHGRGVSPLIECLTPVEVSRGKKKSAGVAG